MKIFMSREPITLCSSYLCDLDYTFKWQFNKMPPCVKDTIAFRTNLQSACSFCYLSEKEEVRGPWRSVWQQQYVTLLHRCSLLPIVSAPDDPKWPWKLQGQRYPTDILQVPPPPGPNVVLWGPLGRKFGTSCSWALSPKVRFVSLYNRSFSRYR